MFGKSPLDPIDCMKLLIPELVAARLRGDIINRRKWLKRLHDEVTLLSGLKQKAYWFREIFDLALEKADEQLIRKPPNAQDGKGLGCETG